MYESYAIVLESYMIDPQSFNLKNAKNIATKIYNEVNKYRHKKVGNQNCLLCTWTAEANFRNLTILPRPVHSPRDKIFSLNPLNIIKNPVKLSIANKEDIKQIIMKTRSDSRFYIHVNWRNSSGGHEFLLLKISNIIYVMDSQIGKVIEFDKANKYFDINYKNSFMCRLDGKELNTDILKYNNKKYFIEWDDDIDPKLL